VCFFLLYKVTFDKYLNPEVEDARKTACELPGMFLLPSVIKNEQLDNVS
jgi:hypothetical protein